MYTYSKSIGSKALTAFVYADQGDLIGEHTRRDRIPFYHLLFIGIFRRASAGLDYSDKIYVTSFHTTNNQSYNLCGSVPTRLHKRLVSERRSN